MTNWTSADIPDQTGRTAVITGANTGLGYETAKALAATGAHVVLAVRNTEKCREAAANMIGNVTVQELDLTSLASIREAAEALKGRLERIDLLINNAGVMTTPKGTTKDGFELQFGTNHLGHFALTGLLLDKLLDVDGARIVTVSSNGHKMGGAIHFDDLQWERKYNRLGAYSQSKLANLLFTYELQRRLAPRGKTIALAAHPGTSTTELARNVPKPVQRAFFAAAPLIAQPAAGGALPSLRAATDPGALGGQYYGPGGIGQQKGSPVVVASSALSYDLDLQRRLWTISEELTKVVFPV
jgi:NAD(P)-dependent dehydrogenase (short-subunit alcohol dehydrogenase family)